MMSAYCFFSARGGDDETSDSNDGERGVMSLEVRTRSRTPPLSKMRSKRTGYGARSRDDSTEGAERFLRLAGHVPVHPLGPHMI